MLDGWIAESCRKIVSENLKFVIQSIDLLSADCRRGGGVPTDGVVTKNWNGDILNENMKAHKYLYFMIFSRLWIYCSNKSASWKKYFSSFFFARFSLELSLTNNNKFSQKFIFIQLN